MQMYQFSPSLFLFRLLLGTFTFSYQLDLVDEGLAGSSPEQSFSIDFITGKKRQVSDVIS